ncbi:hydrolase TatD [Campylobacter sp. MIT 99-7217]|uniref:TatD family hydrolase n=1 Tax=Campylobacter sp. MIT 99-7217 TaxID=535091 RepID=UPI00115C11E8|nr:TatD family hydrolase [Campylobacter sp. MIT 99-7217]TQR31900.1 hydrolase TatD [Campylobacter sp. MIT 99-7217]
MLLDLDFKDEAKIIDTHCHLDDESFCGDLNVILEHSFKNNISKIIIPAANTADLPKALEICERYENIYFAVGTHPCVLESFDEALLRKLIVHEKCVAVGECGLDYFRLENENKEQIKQRQKELFKFQLELAREFEKPVIIHAREANADIFEILNEFIKKTGSSYRQGSGFGVLHCFNASELLLGLKEHFYFGIGGVLTFKNAKNLVQILPKIPKDKLLIETDAPYLSPEPFRGKRNEPLLTNFVAQKMAELLSLSKDEVIELCTQNANELFFKD